MAGGNDKTTGLRALRRELSRRRVDQLVALYAASSFGFAFALDLLVDALGLPQAVLRIAVLIVLLGFPLVMVIGWIYDRTPEGWVRTQPKDPPTFLWTPGVAVLVGTLLLVTPFAVGWVGFRFREVARPGLTGIRTLDDRVAILPFENQTGDPEFESVGLIAADWLIEGLSRMPYLKIVDAQTVLAGWSPQEATAARELDAALVVTGRYQMRGDSLVLIGRIVNRDGTLLAALPSVATPKSNPILALDPLRGRVQAALGAVLDPAIADFESAPGSPPLYDAYQSYMDGLKSYLDGSFIAAGESFANAVRVDETFYRAWIWLAQSDAALLNRARFDSTTTFLAGRRNLLGQYDQNRLDFSLALFDRNYDRMYLAARGMLLAAPGSDDVRREAALSAMRTRRHADAAQLLLELDPERGLIRFWDDYWVELTWVLLRSGDETGALQAAQRGLSQRGPNDLQALASLALVHSYHGRPQETLDAVRRILRSGDEEVLRGIKLLISVSSLLTTSGNAPEGEIILVELLDRLEGAQGGSASSVVARRLELFIRMDKLDDAVVLRDSVAATRSVDHLPVLGVLAAALGDRAEAQAWRERSPGPSGFGAMMAALSRDARGVALNIAQTPDDPHTGIVGGRDPLFQPYWNDPEFISATAGRN